MRWLGRGRRRAWTWFRSLEDWAQASITCATIALVAFSLWLPSFVSGDRPLMPAEIASSLASVAFLYFFCLWLWSVHYYYETQTKVRPGWRRLLLRQTRIGSFTGLFIALEAIVLSVRAVLSGITSLVRHLVRSVRSRSTDSAEPPT